MATDPKTAIEEALRQALREQAPDLADTPIILERPKQAEHGDFSSNLALQLAKPLKKKPRDLAVTLQASVSASLGGLLEKAEVAGPGFINFKLKAGTKTAVIRRIFVARALRSFADGFISVVLPAYLLLEPPQAGERAGGTAKLQDERPAAECLDRSKLTRHGREPSRRVHVAPVERGEALDLGLAQAQPGLVVDRSARQHRGGPLAARLGERLHRGGGIFERADDDRHDRGASQSSRTARRTSAAWPATLTWSQRRATLPSGPMR